MKKSFKSKLFLLAILVFTTINVEAKDAGVFRTNISKDNSLHNRQACIRRPPSKKPPVVGTPIDGGLITLLVGGGMALVGVKKRKDKKKLN